jgi:hypothetical protein
MMRDLRIEAFARFLPLYTGQSPVFARKADAYAWAARVINEGRPAKDCVTLGVRIGRLGPESCRRLTAACNDLREEDP